MVKSCSVPLIDSQMSFNSLFNFCILVSSCEDSIVEVFIPLLILFSFKVLMYEFHSSYVVNSDKRKTNGAHGHQVLAVIACCFHVFDFK